MSRSLFLRRAHKDTPWKQILDAYLPSFMELFFPAIALQIDWQKSYTALDKELHRLNKDALTGERIVDKLFQVSLKDPQQGTMLIHIEIQGQRVKHFARRMFVYRYRLFDRYRHPVLSVAVLADKHSAWRPCYYREENFGCYLEMGFKQLKLLDYQAQKDFLESHHNPFSFVVLAHLAGLENYPNDQAKLQKKIALTRFLYDKSWNRQQVLDLYTFLDYIIVLPIPLAIIYNQAVHRIEEEKNMVFITTAELIGRQQGWAEGRAEGIQEGMQEGERMLLLRLLKRKFLAIPRNFLHNINKADTKTLLKWGERLIDAKTLQDVFAE